MNNDMTRAVRGRKWLFVAVFLLTGCGVGPFPGGGLSGPELPLSAVDAAALEEVSVIVLETRPQAPYSVHVQLFSIAGGLYVDPAPERRWLQFMREDPRVRIQFADDATIYRARAVPEEDPAVLSRFDEGLVIVRLDSE